MSPHIHYKAYNEKKPNKITSVGKNMENRSSSAPTRKNRTEALQRLKIGMAYGAAIGLQGVYLK